MTQEHLLFLKVLQEYLQKLNIWNKLKDKSQEINSILVKDGEK